MTGKRCLTSYDFLIRRMTRFRDIYLLLVAIGLSSVSTLFVRLFNSNAQGRIGCQSYDDWPTTAKRIQISPGRAILHFLHGSYVYKKPHNSASLVDDDSNQILDFFSSLDSVNSNRAERRKKKTTCSANLVHLRWPHRWADPRVYGFLLSGQCLG